MSEIKLEKRYPHSRTEDITDAFMRGYEIGKEQEHRWWSAFCANCKTENSSEIPNNCKAQMDYDKGLQLFADILFDKEKSEQFLKECKAMGIEPQTDCP